ncbi:MAG: thiamine-monophosphate kinase [Verrucomicrobia bacterium]|nr:thiamine-monophosphate kinase [Verrucomicrobiota bacterium]
MTLREVGEEKLLEQLLPHFHTSGDAVVPAGDDCAVFRFPGARDYLVLKTDCVVEAVHFEPNAPASAVGWKAMMRTLSDFAAMSAVPRFALVTLMAPPRTNASWVRALYRGLNRAAARFDVAIAGGETSAIAQSRAITVSAAGYVEPDRCVSRSGGKAGNELFVTGELGGAVNGRHLKFVPRVIEARWLTRQFQIDAMMDLSDGLGSDLPRLARASKLSFEIDHEALPYARRCTYEQAISDGEDYELLFAIAPRLTGDLQKRWRKKFPKLRLTRIGKLTSCLPVAARKLPPGYVHFQERR